MEKFIHYIQQIHPLQEKDIINFLNVSEEMNVSKGDVIIEKGQLDKSIYLLADGVWQACVESIDHTTVIWFAFPGEVVYSTWCYVADKPSQIAIIACGNSKALRISKNDAENLFNSSLDLSIWGRKMSENLLFSTDQWLTELANPLAKERYLSLIEKMPQILQYVSLKDIAAYLGITPQSLSRIRSELLRRESNKS